MGWTWAGFTWPNLSTSASPTFLSDSQGFPFFLQFTASDRALRNTSGRKTVASLLRDRVGSGFQASDDESIAASFNLGDAFEGIFYTKLINSLGIK